MNLIIANRLHADNVCIARTSKLPIFTTDTTTSITTTASDLMCDGISATRTDATRPPTITTNSQRDALVQLSIAIISVKHILVTAAIILFVVFLMFMAAN